MNPLKRVTLIISGSIAAYKALELVRCLQKENVSVTGVLTKGGAEFITPLSVASLSGNVCYTELFSLKDETEMGHIRLSREADMVVVAPATADIMAKMVAGRTDDLATSVLLASDKPILVAPAMNVKMWENEATQRNIAQLRADGVRVVSPAEGEMACGEVGAGRMAEPEDICAAIMERLLGEQPLKGKTALVTSGPTYEAIDPVRFIGNRSSGKQGHAIAAELAVQGAKVTLVSGPTALDDPEGCEVVKVESAAQMMAAVHAAGAVDIAICAAAVSDWTPAKAADEKMKKTASDGAPNLELEETQDILAWLSQDAKPRPELVIGFAAETENVTEYAKAKRARKGCDWLLANDVSKGVFGEDENEVVLIREGGEEVWAKMSKVKVARRLVDEIVALHGNSTQEMRTSLRVAK